MTETAASSGDDWLIGTLSQCGQEQLSLALADMPLGRYIELRERLGASLSADVRVLDTLREEGSKQRYYEDWDLTRPQIWTPGRSLVVVDLPEFLGRALPRREAILLPWLARQVLAMIYAWRGVGKTFVALWIAYAVASRGEVLGWRAPKPRKVLYVDGEMPAVVLQERLARIVQAAEREPETGLLRIITPDLQGACMPDLATRQGQKAIGAAIEADTDLIILDNLSCLARRGGKENEAESWLNVAEWALSLRTHGKSVLFIHHSGKDGCQRGTSKREDQLDTVIALRRPAGYTPQDGAVFEVHYEKCRELHGQDVLPIEAKLTQDTHGKQMWVTRPVEDSTYDRVTELARDGLAQRDIAEELAIDKSRVSRCIRRAKEEGKITDVKDDRGKWCRPQKPRKDIDD